LLNALGPIVLVVVGFQLITQVIRVSSKASESIEVTLVGIVMFLILLYLNALRPMEVTLVGIVTDERDKQP